MPVPAFGFGVPPSHDEHLFPAGLADEPAEKGVERSQARSPARDDVRHRFQAFGPQARGQHDGVVGIGARHVGDVHARPGRHEIAEALDAQRLAHGGFDGKAGQ